MYDKAASAHVHVYTLTGVAREPAVVLDQRAADGAPCVDGILPAAPAGSSNLSAISSRKPLPGITSPP